MLCVSRRSFSGYMGARNLTSATLHDGRGMDRKSALSYVLSITPVHVLCWQYFKTGCTRVFF